VLRTGAPWRDLPEHFGSSSTVYSRFRRWTQAGVWHESLYVGRLLDLGHVRRAGVGRPRLRPDSVVGDRGYSYPSVRRALTKRGIRAVIPRRSDQRPFDRRLRFDTAIYTQHNRVERLVGRLKEFRRVAATRFEKRAVHFLAMVTLAAVLLWL
jgi:transposase